jgi:hypothetical protein
VTILPSKRNLLMILKPISKIPKLSLKILFVTLNKTLPFPTKYSLHKHLINKIKPFSKNFRSSKIQPKPLKIQKRKTQLILLPKVLEKFLKMIRKSKTKRVKIRSIISIISIKKNNLSQYFKKSQPKNLMIKKKP